MLLRRVAAILLGGVLLLAGCGEVDGREETSPQSDVPGAEVDEGFTDTDIDLPDAGDERTGADMDQDSAGVAVAGDLGSKPEVEVPGGEPPQELVIVDVAEGDGEEAAAGDTVTTHYVGVSWLNGGEQFDASWDRGQPISFPLDGVIQGWQDGIPGMRVGGRRLLVIPPEQGYGAQSPTPQIAPNDTLVFVIDLVDVG